MLGDSGAHCRGLETPPGGACRRRFTAVHQIAGLERLRSRVEQREAEPQPISWACGDCIGQGAFGKVVLGLNVATGELMAVKQVPSLLRGHY
jgi:hypothetical protein